MSLTSGLNWAVLTQLLCPENVERNFLSITFQIFIVLSSDAVVKSFPSHEKLTDLTAAVWAFIVEECPSLIYLSYVLINKIIDHTQNCAII